MKILYTQGGLGNQMFQWAFLRYLQRHGRTDVRLDASAPSLRQHTGFDLYRLFPPIAASGLLIPRWIGRPLHLAAELLRRSFGLSLETEGDGPDNTLIPNGKLWLRGFWTQARFAESVRGELLRDFAFSEPADEANRALLHRIDSCQSVSLHVRGGDYLEPRHQRRFGSICTPDYYRRAIEWIRERVADPVFFLFSDDPAWAVRTIGAFAGGGYEWVVVDHNRGLEGYRDMQLMSRCRHHIVANSTFSWWGAWLDPREDKLVCAPSPWLHTHPGEEGFTERLLPEGWIQLTVDN